MQEQDIWQRMADEQNKMHPEWPHVTGQDIKNDFELILKKRAEYLNGRTAEEQEKERKEQVRVDVLLKKFDDGDLLDCIEKVLAIYPDIEIEEAIEKVSDTKT